MRPISVLTTAILFVISHIFMVSGEASWLGCFKDRDCNFSEGPCQEGFKGKCDNEPPGFKQTNPCYCENPITHEKGEYVKFGFAKNCKYGDKACKNECSVSKKYEGYICNDPDVPIRRCLCL